LPGEETDEAIPEEEKELDPYQEQIRQIFELASECQIMAEELYPLPEGASGEMYLAVMKIQAEVHMELFRAIINNAANMVAAQMIAAQRAAAPPGIIVPPPPRHGGRVITVHPPGEGL
jgi:hypothetical protein